MMTPDILYPLIWVCLFIIGFMFVLTVWNTIKVIIFIPLCFIIIVITNITINNIYGYPNIKPLPDEFEFIKYHIANNDNGEMYIYVWLIEEGDKVPRAYGIPYDNKLHKQTEKAREKVEEGVKVKLKKQATPAEKEDGQKHGDNNYRVKIPKPDLTDEK